MTRFEREWNGELGEFWKKHAREEAQRLLDQADKIEVEDDGAAKWKTNGSYLPADVVEKLTFAGAAWFSPEATAAKREKQVTKELEAATATEGLMRRRLPKQRQHSEKEPRSAMS